jgi:hypothetical protein
MLKTISDLFSEIYYRACSFIAETKSADQLIVVVRVLCGFYRKKLISGKRLQFKALLSHQANFFGRNLEHCRPIDEYLPRSD